ncbi:unnamed protein product [Trifolium pratense]|uniref:Uncharacterized protein n=1 Tax=Trifolium pratense TaxID=57577 RepID=A0ACB0LUP2_TRIPR|nr:unnamed protein product [Trifolium pratense]
MAVASYSRYASLEDLLHLLKFSADAKYLNFGKTIHTQLLIRNQSSNRHPHIVQLNSLINLYVKCSKLRLARYLFDEMPLRNVVSYNALMAGYLHSGEHLEVISLFKKMVSSFQNDVLPNEHVFTTILSACGHSGRVFEGMQCHGYLFKFGLVFHHYVKSALVHMYSKCFHVDLALQVLDSEHGSNNDAFCYNSVLKALVESRRLAEAMDVLGRMVDECVVWDNVTYVSVMGLCGQIRDLRLGLQVHAQLLKGGLTFDVFVGSMLVDMYGKCGNILHARKVFDALQNRNVVVWTSLMTAYLQNGDFEETLNLLTCMDQEGTMPNEFTFAVLLNACAGIAALKHGDIFHGRVEKLGFKNRVIVGNALINMYSKSGSIDSSYNVFFDMMHRDIITWNAMICGYSQHGLGKQTLLVFEDMMSNGECPNHVTFVGVLSACAHLALVNEGFYYLNQLMKHFKIEPGLEHYTCMVAVMCRAGLLEEAENFMKTTQVKWDVVAWRVLLNACNVHRNYSLGKQIAETILQMDPRDVGTYTLLSNMYAKARSWDGVTTIRKMMRERNVKKEPGVSWLEIRNVVHVFSSDGSNHPECIQIYSKVQILLEKIKQLGYIPNIEAVLHDVEDEQKESYLNYHSEKLAIAYGLMKIPSPAPIRVIKNLRICDDCHTAVKLISKVTNRLIIVRDASRFHHFRDGTCTCSDHW